MFSNVSLEAVVPEDAHWAGKAVVNAYLLHQYCHRGPGNLEHQDL